MATTSAAAAPWAKSSGPGEFAKNAARRFSASAQLRKDTGEVQMPVRDLQFCDPEAELLPGAELALIPPVSGG